MKILHLTLYKQWFDQILSGEKTSEFRADTPYWRARITGSFDYVHFVNGYGKQRPWMDVELKCIKLNLLTNKFELMLGKILRKGNL